MTPVLLVSSDRELSRMLKLALRETQAKVAFETASPKSAADILAAHPGAMVVLDLFVPESSGLEVLKTLKRVNESGLFLFLTRMRTRTLIERAFRLGAQDVLHWPVSTDVLRNTILHRLEAQPLPDADEPAEQGGGKPARKKEPPRGS